jgi:hypothetical protein
MEDGVGLAGLHGVMGPHGSQVDVENLNLNLNKSFNLDKIWK